jgi:hypothetical protein
MLVRLIFYYHGYTSVIYASLSPHLTDEYCVVP